MSKNKYLLIRKIEKTLKPSMELKGKIFC